jgi:hypothetical protein
MSHCRCERPSLNDRRPDFCRRCGVKHSPRILSSDTTLAEFQAEVAKLPGVTPGIFTDSFRRERAGRVEFGLKYLGRDNCAEGLEEAADGFNYACFAWLNDRRAGTEAIDPELLTAAHHFALAHAALERKRRQ